jgi:signal transduction histidine kinase
VIRVNPFRELPRLSEAGPPRALRAFGLFSMAVILVSTFGVDPSPGTSGDGLLVLIAIVLFVAGLAASAPLQPLPPGVRLTGLLAVAVASCIFAAVQPDSAGFAGVYYVVVIAGIRMPRVPATIVAAGTLTAEVVILSQVHDKGAASAVGLVFSVVPWFLITRLIRQLAYRRDKLERTVEELHESREAATQSAALAERGRMARDMHDVLAHSLSALALQLEGTRLLARDRGADPEVVAGLERAHRLAASGLAEARQAIAALRGDELPSLRDLADAFGPNASLTVIGTPGETSSEARLALYRTTQEALTNVRKHSAGDRVDIRVEYGDDGTRLLVQDHGPGEPVIVGAGGYGLTGMRERAELLGGRLDAGPTRDGFRVELWLPTEIQQGKSGSFAPRANTPSETSAQREASP